MLTPKWCYQSVPPGLLGLPRLPAPRTATPGDLSSILPQLDVGDGQVGRLPPQY